MLDVTYLLIDATMTLDNSPGLQSQVLDRMKYESLASIQAGLVTTVADPVHFDEVAGKALRVSGIPFETFSQRSLPATLASAACAIRRFERSHPSRCIYVRGIWGAMAHCLAFPFGGPPLVYDFRGDLVAEAKARGGSRHRLSILERLTRFSVQRSNRVLTVSQAGSEVLAARYGAERAVIIPSAVDPDPFNTAQASRQELRGSLGFTDEDMVLVYSGSVSSYQLIPEMLELWGTLNEMPSLRFLLLTSRHPGDLALRSVDAAKARLPLVHMTLEREEVPGYLAAADVGFLLRRDDDINRVAFPIKFAEYLAAGLAVVTSPGIGNIQTIVQEHDIGLLVNPDGPDEAVVSIRDFVGRVRSSRAEFRSRAKRAVTEEHLDWSSHMRDWRDLITSVGEEFPGRGLE